MFGIILIIIIGQKFYRLANTFKKKNIWLYPIIGIAMYYFGAIIVGGITLIIIIEFILNSSLENYSDAGLGIMLMPFGIIATYLLYNILRKKWRKEYALIKEEIDDIGKNQDLIS